MAGSTTDEHRAIEERIVGLYNVLYVDDITTDDIEFYELTDDDYEGEVYLPHIGINVAAWRDWTTEKRVEVLVHEFAHTENYDDDHHPDFWNRVVDLTEVAVAHEDEIASVFGEPLDPEELKRTVVGSVHEGVIEPDVDTVEARKRAVADALGLPLEGVGSD